MRKIVTFVILIFSFICVNAQQDITVGMTGSQVRNAINKNFDTIYVSNSNIVSKSLSRYSTIQATINAATSGTAIVIESGVYTEQITLKDGVDLIGSGSVQINTTDIAHTTITANSVNCNIHGINFGGNKYVLTATNSTITFTDCTLSGSFSLWNGGYITLNNSDVIMTDVKLEYSNINAYTNSSFKFFGREMEVLLAKFTTGSTFEINVDKWIVPSNTGNFQFLEMGILNPYQSLINPSTGAYSNKSDPDYITWKNYNETGNVKGILTVRSMSISVFKAIYLFQNSDLTILNSMMYDPVTYRRVSAKFNDHARFNIINSSIGSCAIGYGDMLFTAYNSRFTYDQDYSPFNGDPYDTDNWVQSAGTHLFEQQTPEWRNKEVYPTLQFKKCIIEYMGDDVLNGLTDTVALKNLGVNLNYRVTTTAYPSAVTHVKWQAGRSYTAGQVISHQHPAYGLADSIAFYVIKNFTAGATINVDYTNGNVRKLFGANKQANGYYQQLYYEYTTVDGWNWRPGFKLGVYHGGKFRNSGNSFYQSTMNLIMEDCIINEHMDVWNAGFYYVQPFWDGEVSYTSSFGLRAGKYLIKNLTLNQVGEYGTIGGNFGISVLFNDSIPINTADIDGLRITGDHQLGIMVNAGKTASDATYLRLNDYTYTGKNLSYNNTYRFSDESTAIVGTYGKAYLLTYLRFDKNLIMNLTQRQLSAELTDNTPTDTEIDTATGLTPATAGTGWKCVIKDTNGSGLLYLIESDGTNWQYTKLAIAE